jgi:hypothetical protein
MTVEAAEDSSSVACQAEAPLKSVATLEGDGLESDGDGVLTEGDGVATGVEVATTGDEGADADADGAIEPASPASPHADASADSARTTPTMTKRLGVRRVVEAVLKSAMLDPQSLESSVVPHC